MSLVARLPLRIVEQTSLAIRGVDDVEFEIRCACRPVLHKRPCADTPKFINGGQVVGYLRDPPGDAIPLRKAIQYRARKVGLSPHEGHPIGVVGVFHPAEWIRKGKAEALVNHIYGARSGWSGANARIGASRHQGGNRHRARTHKKLPALQHWSSHVTKTQASRRAIEDHDTPPSDRAVSAATRRNCVCPGVIETLLSMRIGLTILRPLFHYRL